MERCSESHTGRILVPNDILKRYIKETKQFDENKAIIRGEIIEIARNFN